MTRNDSTHKTDLFQIIPSHLAIKSMRDSGYKNTAYALAELIDNAQQAGATVIELLCIQKYERVRERERARISKIAVLDNGSGMDASTLRIALQFGNGKYLQDRSGIGRFGMGLPNASISQAGRVDVWSWQNGADNALYTYLDLSDIESGKMQEVPEPISKAVPEEWRTLSNEFAKSGTLVVWSELESHRLTWKSAKTTLIHTGRLAGRIYRHFISDGSIRIRLFAKDEEGDISYDKEADFDDPLYLNPSPLVPAPFDKEAMFENAFEDSLNIEFNGRIHKVKIRYSVAKSTTVEHAGSGNRGHTQYGKHAGNNMGVSVVRAGRELMLDRGWCINYDPRERWWGAEVEFPPELDEIFGVTNNKQTATHFAELATMDWEHLKEGEESFRDVVDRLKEEGDPHGYLLPLQDGIKRSLHKLRDIIGSQGKGRRSSRRDRHESDKPDNLTRKADERWKKRSKQKPISGEGRPRTEDDYEEIKKDVIEKGYAPNEVDELLKLIRSADLQVVFLESDFPNPYQLFNIEFKGNLTEIIFNRKHPAFLDIFGTLDTVDEDMEDLELEDISGRLVRAVNASKILFAAWARYEREAGVDNARKLEKIRYAWGQIAANFLDPEGDLDLADV